MPDDLKAQGLRPFLFRCPTTEQDVQGLLTTELEPADTDRYVPVECAACNGIHLINPITHRSISDDY